MHICIHSSWFHFNLETLQHCNIATLQCKFQFILIYYLFCRDIENLILTFPVIQHFVYFLFFVWNSYSFFSELKADAPACAPSLSSAGIPFKGAVWLLLYNLLEVSFPKCSFWKSCWVLFICDSLLTWVWVGIKHISSLFSQQWMTHHAPQWIQHVAWKCQVTCHAGETLTW